MSLIPLGMWLVWMLWGLKDLRCHFSLVSPPCWLRMTLRVMKTSRWNKGLKKLLMSKGLWCLKRSSLGTHKWQRDERPRPSAEPVQRAVNEHGFMGATGKGRWSGSESRRIEPRQQVAVEGRSLARVESVSQGSNIKCEGFWCSCKCVTGP